MTRARPAGGEVHLWWADLDAGAPAPDAALAMLSPEERARVARVGREPHRGRTAVRRAILRSLLGRYLELDPTEVPLTAGPNGKLACSSAPELAFNVSSSRGAALYGFFSGSRIGVDVEARPDGEWEALPVGRYLSDAERARLEAATGPEATRMAAEAWVAKEAVAKAVGAGLTLPPSAIELSPRAGELAVALTGPWSAHDSAHWCVRVVGDGVRTVAAVATDGECTAVVSRDYSGERVLARSRASAIA